MEKSRKVFLGRQTVDGRRTSADPNAFEAARRPHYTGRPINLVEHEIDLERRNQFRTGKHSNCTLPGDTAGGAQISVPPSIGLEPGEL